MSPNTSVTVQFETVTPDDVAGQYNSRDYSHAMDVSNKVIRDGATRQHHYQASLVYVSTPGSRDDKRTAFETKLRELASDETRQAAEQAFVDSLLKSDELRAERINERNKARAIQAAQYAEQDEDGEPDDYAASMDEDEDPDED